MARATVYSGTYCPYCRNAIALLKRRNAEIEVIDVTDDDETLAWLSRETGRDTIPQIWIGDTYVGGYDDLTALDQAGKLKPLLEA